jgi:hypothetical protein
MNKQEKVEILEGLIVKWNAHPSLDYGNRDCGAFFAELYKAFTGKTILSDWQGQYNNEETLTKWVDSLGYENINEALTDIINIKSQSPTSAKYGDPVTFISPKGVGIGICKDNKLLFLNVKNRGFIRMPLRLGSRSWSIK